VDSPNTAPSVYRASLETYYKRTYGDQIAVRLASIALVSGVTVFLDVWPLAWAAVWALGYLAGELGIVVWWRHARVALNSSTSPTFGRLQTQLIALSALVSSYGAIPCFFTLGGNQGALLLGVLLSAGILLTIAAQHSLHRQMFLATAPVAAVALVWNLFQLGEGSTPWLFAALGVIVVANARFLQKGNARAFEELIAHKVDAERALARSRESEDLYRLLADNQSDMVALWRDDGSLVYSSPSVLRTFGFTAGENPLVSDLFNTYPDDKDFIQGVFSTLAPQDGIQRAEYRLFHKDGSIVWLDGTFQRLDDGSRRILATGRVVTERKRLEGELHRALDEARAALGAKSDFLANMTHELRTPLTAIVGFSGLLRKADDLSPRHARQVGLINDASENLLSVVNDVLDFSRLEAGAVELDSHPFDPVDMAGSTVALLDGQAVAKGLRMRVEVEGFEGSLLGDGARLRQVLTNLVSNAVKFTASGEIRVRVRQARVGDQRKLRVSVQDSGIGVPADKIAGIFGRFTQADASVSRQFGGTGLGLAISRRIIQAMDGEMGVESEAGIGSTFWFEIVLPSATESGTDDMESAPTLSPDAPLRLLVVDDNAVNRELVCALLEPFDVDIETASDGVEALDAVASKDFDLILMDVQMPNMDGLTATQRIRAAAAPGSLRVPIIALTANLLPEHIARCREAGMDDHLGKPINPERLLDVLARWSPEPVEDEGSQDLAASR